jgi:hypothetical protein
VVFIVSYFCYGLGAVSGFRLGQCRADARH